MKCTKRKKSICTSKIQQVHLKTFILFVCSSFEFTSTFILFLFWGITFSTFYFTLHQRKQEQKIITQTFILVFVWNELPHLLFFLMTYVDNDVQHQQSHHETQKKQLFKSHVVFHIFHIGWNCFTLVFILGNDANKRKIRRYLEEKHFHACFFWFLRRNKRNGCQKGR